MHQPKVGTVCEPCSTMKQRTALVFVVLHSFDSKTFAQVNTTIVSNQKTRLSRISQGCMQVSWIPHVCFRGRSNVAPQTIAASSHLRDCTRWPERREKRVLRCFFSVRFKSGRMPKLGLCCSNTTCFRNSQCRCDQCRTRESLWRRHRPRELLMLQISNCL